MTPLYPLRFQPLFRNYLWGGSRLRSLLNKQTGPGIWAESWEVVDHANGQSVVLFGPLAGQSLTELIAVFGPKLVGEESFSRITGPSVPKQLRLRFPLLFKYLDANQDLSVQVHPDDAMAATLGTPDLGKTEAWLVLHAEPGAKIFAGFKPGVSRPDFIDAIVSGCTAELLNVISAHAGQCIFIPAGTIHAIGAGLVVAEIQQASDTTFRVFDWNRKGAGGKPRPLHIDQALAATNFETRPIVPQPRMTDSKGNRDVLVSCPYFQMNLLNIDSDFVVEADGRFRILAVIRGQVEVEGDWCGEPLNPGETILLPAGLSNSRLSPVGATELLEIFVP